ncbi:MAG: DUF2206 domain-containing protein [Candidatus Aenigmatarchaeota archaeon]
MGQLNRKKPNQQMLYMLFLQIAANISILFNIPVARQVIGFTFFTFVPGYALIKLLKMRMESLTETVLFSTGISIIFLMLIGLAINELNSMFAVQTPLSLAFLLPALNIFTLTCIILSHIRHGSNESLSTHVENLSALLILLCIPALSISGAITSGVYNDNRILIFTITAIAALFTIVTISQKTVLTKLYPFIVLIIAISLIYHSQMVSDKLLSFGSDVGGEVFAQKIVEKNAYWNPVNPYPRDQSVGRTYAMLSVTILPTVYSILLNLDSILVFKLLYSFIFALVPLGLYNLWKNFVSEKFAFISAFFFMSFQPFYGEMLGLNKQMMGELFLVLLLTAILKEKTDRSKKIVCPLLFSFALIVSHYALAEIFLFFISFVLIVSILTKKPSRNITLTFVLFFFTIMFVWYIYISSSSVFEAFLTFGQRVYNELGDFFNLQSREPEILRGLGLEPPPTIWNLISRVFAYMTEALIVVGFIHIILKRTKIYLEKEYFFLIFVSMLFLGALIAIPGLSSTMNMTRFYHILLFFLAPLCVLGAETIVNVVSRKNTEIKALFLLLMVLVPYFLFQTSFVYEVTGSESWSIPLSKYRMSPLRLNNLGYGQIYSVYGQRWLSSNVIAGQTPIYCDPFSDLRCYALIYRGYFHYLSKVISVAVGGVVYLSSLSVIHSDYVALHSSWNVSELQFLNEISRVYTNGKIEILCKNG